MQTIHVQINPKIIVYALLGIGLAWLIIQLKEILLILFIAFTLNAAFRPLVNRLEARGIARFVSILIIYLVLFLILTLVLVVIANEFVNQVANLVNALPGIYARFVVEANTNFPLFKSFNLGELQPGIDELVSRVTESQFIKDLLTGENLSDVAQRALVALSALAGLVVSVFTTIMISVYMLQRKRNVYTGMITLLPKRKAEFASRVMTQVESSLGAWLSGQFILMLAIGVVTFLVLWIPGLFDPTFPLDEFALPVALLAALLEALPNVGPLISLIFGSIIALGTGGIGPFIYVVISFFAIQNLESIFLVPVVMKKAVDIDPILTIVGIIGAFQLGGPMLALLAVPLIAVIQIGLKEIVEEYRQPNKD